MAGQELKSSWKKEMDQAKVTEAATKQYNKSVQQKAPADEQKKLHDTKVWEETKSHALGCATTQAGNQLLAEKNNTTTQVANKSAAEQNEKK